MKVTPGILCILLALVPLSAPADTLTLKSGEVLKGEILRETPESIVINNQFSPNIVEERTVARADIEKIEREQADEKAFGEIAAIPLPATAFDAEVYNEVINGQLEPFLKKYPYSIHAEAVRAKIAEFQAEKKRLSEGRIKLEGRWVMRAQIEEETYQLDAQRAYEVIERQFLKYNLVGALNQFDAFETKWPYSTSYPDAVEMARRMLGVLNQVLTHQLRNFPIKEQRRQLALERAPVEVRAQVAAAQKEELAAAVAAVAASRAAGKYSQYSPLDRGSMEGLQKLAQDEGKRLGGIDLKPLRTAIGEAQLAARQIEQNQLALAETSLQNAGAAWPQLELLPRLKKRLDDAKAAAAASNEAQAKAVQDAADLEKKESAAESKQP